VVLVPHPHIHPPIHRTTALALTLSLQRAQQLLAGTFAVPAAAPPTLIGAPLGSDTRPPLLAAAVAAAGAGAAAGRFTPISFQPSFSSPSSSQTMGTRFEAPELVRPSIYPQSALHSLSPDMTQPMSEPSIRRDGNSFVFGI
jgi:hypothetical protein